MSDKILFTIKIPEEEIKIRKELPPPEKTIKDKKKYTRKKKHKNRSEDDSF